jgi:hypothetical protein
MQMSAAGTKNSMNNDNARNNAHRANPTSPLDRITFKAGWVDVSTSPLPPHSAQHDNTHSSTNNSTNSADKLHGSIVHGDFYIWSEGPKLTAESINSSYVGMNRTAVTHNNENGVLV